MKRIDQVFDEELLYIEARMKGLIKSMLTPWPTINKAGIQGWEWGTINTIAAMSGVGKTAAVNQLVTETHGCNPGEPISILFYTMEMAATKLIARTISHDIKWTVQDIYTNMDQAKLDYIKTNIKVNHDQKDIFYEEIPKTSFATRNEIEAFIKARPRRKVLVIYDHALLVRSDNQDSERERLIQLMSHFNDLKKIYPNSMYILLAQLNRDLEDMSRILKPMLQFPKKGDIFGSDACFQFSDVVLVLHDPYKLNIVQYGPNKWPTRGFVFGHLLKVREGIPDKVVMFHNKLEHNRLVELTQQDLTNFGFK